MYENEDEMILSNVVNEGPASPIAMSDDSDHKGGRMTTRSMAAASLRRSSIRHDSLPLENQIEEEVQMQEPEGNQCEEDDEQFLMDALLKVRRKRRVKTPEGDDKHAAEATKTRRIYNPWTDDELHALSEGVQRFGPRWIRIKEEYKGVWRNRTNIDLKDKARNVIKQKQREGQDLGHWACCVRH
ncbi:hypothetical protein BX666DRAFT_1991756 [Dichotomocladium elegans]|nr:hypothetical protein BX666DRAFT_1991756 [Dichotomocladium elegans]